MAGGGQCALLQLAAVRPVNDRVAGDDHQFADCVAAFVGEEREQAARPRKLP